MLVSYSWLQTYFKEPLPAPRALSTLLNTRAFEVEGITPVGTDYAIDIDVQPNRAHDCFCHEGIAKEISVLMNIPLQYKEVSVPVAHAQSPFTVSIADGVPCTRYSATLVEGVTVGQAQSYITDRLHVLEQRSINHIVDSANYVMFEMGQPTHAFDADKIAGTTIFVRPANAGETMTTLDNKEVVFAGGEMVIADSESILAIAGIKGGKKAEVTEHTTRIILECAHFNATAIRRTSAALGISTDASKRFERGITPAFVEKGMRYLCALLQAHDAKQQLQFYTTIDVYPRPAGTYKTGISVSELHAYVGLAISDADIEATLRRLDFPFTKMTPHDAVVERAISLVGTAPYVYGASVLYDAPRAFDCSSFVSYLYKEAGVSIPRVTVDQYMWGTPITKDELMPGDVIFCNLGATALGADKQFYHEKTIDFMPGTVVPEKIDHNGIYIGNGEVVHASSKAGNTVTRERLDDSVIFSHIVGYRRMAKPHESRYVITVPEERLDIRITADVVEEIARVIGYEHIVPKPLSTNPESILQSEYEYLNMLRTTLCDHGFSEIMTPTFVATGDIEVVKAIASDKGFLRTNLADGIQQALSLNEKYLDGIGIDRVRIFEIGHVFTTAGEQLHLALGVSGKKADVVIQEILATLSLDGNITNGVCEIQLSVPATTPVVPLVTTGGVVYKPFSSYPYIVRDIAFWVQGTPQDDQVARFGDSITQTAGSLLTRLTLFDMFEKDGRTSYAYRLVFQSMERTLTDEEVQTCMNAVSETLRTTFGAEIR